MRFWYFDDDAREYVIDHEDVPLSITNYMGARFQFPCAMGPSAKRWACTFGMP